MADGWRVRALGAMVAAAVGVAACAGADAEATAPTSTASTSTAPTSSTTSTTVVDARPDRFARPDWLGTRILPEGPEGFGAVLRTPAELDPRALRTPAALADPAGAAFISTVTAVPDDVLSRSTWGSGCPVTPEQLRYVTVTFWGFDGEHHTGELLVGAAVADDMVQVFGRLDAARFPIEEMRITSPDELDLAPTGDGNNTSAFVCRPVRRGTSFSQHAFGTAIDVNPFHNPYVRGEIVLPELASTYVDRGSVREGMVTSDGVVVEAFASVGWEWGGAWGGATTDSMHFSETGR